MLKLFTVVCGLYLVRTEAEHAPAAVTMEISFKTDNLDGSEVILSSCIGLNNSSISTSQRKFLLSLKEKEHHFDLNFYVDDIKEPLEFIGNLRLTERNGITNVVCNYKESFSLTNLKRKDYKKEKITTFYSSTWTNDLDVKIRTRCKENFYPAQLCNKECVKDQFTQQCDKNGNKICNKGYYLKGDQCVDDWCSYFSTKCLNGGVCLNMPTSFKCQCSLSYAGTYCEKYLDKCLTFKCPNGTTCVMEKERIDCKNQLTTLEFKMFGISLVTMITIGISIAILVLGFSVTLWACKRPKNASFKNSGDSMNYKHPLYRGQLSDHEEGPTHVCCQYSSNIQAAEWLPTQMGNYYSLRYPHGHSCGRPKRTNSDILVQRNNTRFSVASSNHSNNSRLDVDTLPLPPPIESEHFANDILIL